MIHDLKPYPAMKDSGVPWVGQVPEHWDIQRGKRLFQKMNRPVDEAAETVTCFRDGVVTLRKNRRLRGFTEALKEIGYQGVQRGDLVIHAMDAFAGAIGVSDSDGKATPVYAVCIPREDADPKYYAFVTRQMAQTQWILALSRGIRERSTDFRFEAFGNQSLPVPPQNEQAAIVRFLEHADRRIRKAIAAKQKLIKLLQEQKQVIIHQAVTRGLDPNVKLKPSGVEWLGDVPEGWDIVKSKRLFKSSKDLAKPGDIQLSATQAYGVIPQAEYEEKIGRRVVKIFMHLDKRKHVREGDFVMSMRSFQGGLERAWSSGAIRSSYVILRPAPAVDIEFFSYLLKSQGYIRALQTTANFIRDGQDLTEDNFREVDLPIMPLAEQRAIARHISEALRGAERAGGRLEREIALLREYRTRLIADVVMGKLDVRNAAARLPELTDEVLPDELDAHLDGDEVEGDETEAESTGGVDHE